MSALATTIPVPCGAFMPVFVIGKSPHPIWSWQEERPACQPKQGHPSVSPGVPLTGRERAEEGVHGWVPEEPPCPLPASLCGQAQPLGGWWGRAWQPGSPMASTLTATPTASCRGAMPWWVSTGPARGHHGGITWRCSKGVGGFPRAEVLSPGTGHDLTIEDVLRRSQRLRVWRMG